MICGRGNVNRVKPRGIVRTVIGDVETQGVVNRLHVIRPLQNTLHATIESFVSIADVAAGLLHLGPRLETLRVGLRLSQSANIARIALRKRPQIADVFIGTHLGLRRHPSDAPHRGGHARIVQPGIIPWSTS
jgi:hypothetical protein